YLGAGALAYPCRGGLLRPGFLQRLHSPIAAESGLTKDPFDMQIIATAARLDARDNVGRQTEPDQHLGRKSFRTPSLPSKLSHILDHAGIDFVDRPEKTHV